MSMYVDIEEGAYKNNLPYPQAPMKPAVLRKVAGDLTPEEIGSLPQVTEEYGLALAEYHNLRLEHNNEDQRLYKKFREDALEYVGLKDHPKAGQAFSMAWERGTQAAMVTF